MLPDKKPAKSDLHVRIPAELSEEFKKKCQEKGYKQKEAIAQLVELFLKDEVVTWPPDLHEKVSKKLKDEGSDYREVAIHLLEGWVDGRFVVEEG